jgi:hypothetical protein
MQPNKQSSNEELYVAIAAGLLAVDSRLCTPDVSLTIATGAIRSACERSPHVVPMLLAQLLDVLRFRKDEMSGIRYEALVASLVVHQRSLSSS